MSLETQVQELIDLSSYPQDSSLYNEGSNVPVTVTLPADTTNGKSWHIDTITVSYSAAPTGGLLSVYGGATPFRVDIIAGGPTAVAVFRNGTPGQALSVVLAPGGSGITGRVNVNAKLV